MEAPWRGAILLLNHNREIKNASGHEGSHTFLTQVHLCSDYRRPTVKVYKTQIS
jgi:hypothetical protein